MISSGFKLQATVNAALDPPILPDGTRVIQSLGWYQTIAPGLKEASANEVMLSQLSDADVDRKIDDAFAIYRQHDLPFKWAIGPMSSPARIEARIAPLAAASWEFRGMTIGTRATLPTNDAVEIKQVDSANFDNFVGVNLSGWDLGAVAEQSRRKFEKMVSHPRYRCFVASIKGEPVGTAATILKDGYGYLTGAVVLEKFRGCGAYKQLINARLADLKNSGIELAVTQARQATSAPILAKIGFETVFNAKIYRF